MIAITFDSQQSNYSSSQPPKHCSSLCHLYDGLTMHKHHTILFNDILEPNNSTSSRHELAKLQLCNKETIRIPTYPLTVLSCNKHILKVKLNVETWQYFVLELRLCKLQKVDMTQLCSCLWMSYSVKNVLPSLKVTAAATNCQATPIVCVSTMELSWITIKKVILWIVFQLNNHQHIHEIQGFSCWLRYTEGIR